MKGPIVDDMFSEILSSGRRELTEYESKLVFDSYGIPVVQGEIAKTLDEALTIGNQMRFPLVLKIASPDILHKTDVGGVRTGIESQEGIVTAYSEILSNVTSKRPDARIEGIMLQPMERRGLEVIIGGVHDPVFGNIIMFGMGGILTEILKDVKFGLAPLDHDVAIEMIESIRVKELLHGYRGGTGVDVTALADIMVRISELMSHPAVSEIDANPVFARADDAICVDARIILKNPSDDINTIHQEEMRSPASIDSLFSPSSVILVGSSSIFEKGGMASPKLFDNIRLNLERYFSGNISVHDIEMATDHELSSRIADCAVMALPPHESLEKLPYLNVKTIIQITGGFFQAQRKTYLDIIREKNIRALGPNTIMGVISPEHGLNTSFEKDLMPKNGHIAVLSQSGGVGAILLDWAKYYGIGISRFAFMGDKMDISDTDLLLYLDSDPLTRVICIYMEGVRDGREFVDVVKKIRKPILVLKGGKSEASKQRAASHTASMAGSDEVFNAAFERAGILRVHSIDELFNGALALVNQPPMKGKRVAVVSNVGGPAILAADALEVEGLQLAPLSRTTSENLSNKLGEIFPDPESVINPIDTIADARADRFELILEEIINDDNVDGIMVINMLKSTFFQPEEAIEIARIAESSPKPIIDVPAGGEDYFKVREFIGDRLPSYDLPEKAAKVLRLLYEHQLALQKKDS